MNKIAKRKVLRLIPIGIFIIAISQIAAHYFVLTDFTKAALMGFGIGVALVPLISRNSKKHS